MSDSMILWCPRPPDNANNRGHWRIGQAQKKKYWAELDRRRAIRLIPDPRIPAFDRVALSSTWYLGERRKRLDPDNAVRRLKPLIDWLVGQGYFAGDMASQLSILSPEQLSRRVPNDAPPLSSVRLLLTPTPF